MAVSFLLDIKDDVILSSRSHLASYARGIVSSIAKKKKIPLEEVASLMRRDGSTISSLISRFSQRYDGCSKTESLVEKTITKAQEIAELDFSRFPRV